MKFFLRLILDLVLFVFLSPIFLINAFILRYLKSRQKPRLLFGPIPIINNKYWSLAMKENGFYSKTLMFDYFSINNREDYDIYYGDFEFKYFKLLNKIFLDFIVFFYSFNNFDIYHFSFNGGILQRRFFFRYFEFILYQIANKKTIILPYGSDIYLYSKIIDIPWKQSLMINYPQHGKDEQEIEKRINFLQRNSDFIIAYIDYVFILSYWNMLTVGAYTIDEDKWSCEIRNNNYNGLNSKVRIAHAPNHRGVKGTEFIIDVIEKLKDRGYKIELVIIEKMKNDDVKELLKTCDILVDQLNLGYAMNAIEGMSLSMPVITNLTNNNYTKVFKQYAFLDECPLVSSDYETLYSVLEDLIQNSEKRKEIGKKSRQYIEKYHSKKTAYLMFSNIYSKIWNGENIDLINYFHPKIGKFNNDFLINERGANK